MNVITTNQAILLSILSLVILYVGGYFKNNYGGKYLWFIVPFILFMFSIEDKIEDHRSLCNYIILIFAFFLSMLVNRHLSIAILLVASMFVMLYIKNNFKYSLLIILAFAIWSNYSYYTSANYYPETVMRESLVFNGILSVLFYFYLHYNNTNLDSNSNLMIYALIFNYLANDAVYLGLIH